jgi:hypothetical protein
MFKPFFNKGWLHLQAMDELLLNMATNVTGANVHRGTQPIAASTPPSLTLITDAPRSASSSSKRKLIEFETFGSGISGSGISGQSGKSGISSQSGQSSAGKKRKNKGDEVAMAVDNLATVYGDIRKSFDSPQDLQSKAAVRLEQIIKQNTWLTEAQCFQLIKLIEKDGPAASVLAMSSRDSGLEKAWVWGHLGLDRGSQD